MNEYLRRYMIWRGYVRLGYTRVLDVTDRYYDNRIDAFFAMLAARRTLTT